MNEKSFIKSNAIWIICLLSFLPALAYNELNLSKIDTAQKRENETIITNDDASYLTPPKNYIKNGVWKDNSIGDRSYFLRPPGYGFLYYTIVKLTGFKFALKGLKIIQLLLFSFSVYWLFQITLYLTKNKSIALITAGTYGLMPFSIGFLYYTLTEGITPSLLLLYIFLLLKSYHQKNNIKKNIFYFLAALSFAYLLVVRPQLGFFGILIPIIITQDYWTNSIKKVIIHSIIFSVIGFSFLGMWSYRNYKITHQVLNIHPIYYIDGNSFFRPTLKAYWNFVGGWAQEGAVTYSYMIPMWQAAIKGDTSALYTHEALNTFPKKVIRHFGRDKLINAFKKYQESVLYQKKYFEQKLPMPKQLSKIEIETIEAFNTLTDEYKNNFWLEYHIIAPFKVFKLIAFHSNLSLYIFQHTYRGLWLIEALRLISYIIHLSIFLVMLLNIFLIKNKKSLVYIVNFICFLYVFYLSYFQRGIEERYTLPMIPILIIAASISLNNRFNLK